MECLKMSTINGGHYQLRISLVRAATADGYYSAKAFPDNAPCVDEGRGCDIVFTLDGCTYHIEVKSSEEDGAGFTLGTSEIRCAREIAQKRRKRDREKYFVLKVDHALSAEPRFTLLPNPYDPAHKDRFVIVDEGARVTYRT